MAANAASLVVLLLVATLAAGCAGNGSSSAAVPTASGDAPVNPVELDEETGAIVGVVTDDQLVPIRDVVVRLDQGAAETLSDFDGNFSFSRVPPGDHLLEFSKSGHLSALIRVAVTVGEITTTKARLATTVEPTTAYYETVHKAGFDGCSFGYRLEDKPSGGISTSSLNYSYPACDAVSFEPVILAESILPYPLGNVSSLTGFFSEVTFTPTNALSEEMFLTWTYEQSTAVHHNFARDLGPDPVRTRVEIATLWERIANETLGVTGCTMDNCTLWLWHAVGYYTLVAEPYGVGLGLQQRFDDWVTFFYNTALPERFTVLPDS